QPGSDYALGVVGLGVQNEQTIYAARVASLDGPNPPWVKICDVDDDVTEYVLDGNDVYLCTHKDAPRFKIVRAALNHASPIQFETVVPQGSCVLRSLSVAADAIYACELDDGVQHILR